LHTKGQEVDAVEAVPELVEVAVVRPELCGPPFKVPELPGVAEEDNEPADEVAVSDANGEAVEVDAVPEAEM
jgi:hypothetical protein